jgi:methylmalonyl-CoA mutase C-terminal domain/subunit
VLNISVLSGAQNTLVPKILNGLAEYAALADTLVVVSGIIPDDDEPMPVEQGVGAIFGPGASMDKTVEFIRENAPER